MGSKDKKNVWVEELCEFLRELAETDTEALNPQWGVCRYLEKFGDKHGLSLYLDEDIEPLVSLWSRYSGDRVYPVAGFADFDASTEFGESLWDTELRREYALELADLIEEAWEAAA